MSILSILVAALLVALVAQKLKQPTLVGYTLAGVLIGPYGFGLVPYENVELLAELGVGLLMFVIGLELSIHKLMRVKNIAVFGGLIQVSIIIAFSLLFGNLMGWPQEQSLVIGFVLSLSSTAVVLKLLAERGEVGSTHANISTGTLLFQDIVSVPMLVFIPVMAKKGLVLDQSVLILIGQFTIYIIVLYASAKFIVPFLLQAVAKTHSKELFSIAIISICLGIAAISHSVGLSLALGAFLAGLVVSESDFANQATTEILPLRDSFAAIFFASIGMLMNPSVFYTNFDHLALVVLLIICGKFLLISTSVLLFRYPVKTSIFVGLGLAQIGEFSLLLLMSAQSEKLLDSNFYQLFLASTLVTIITTPYLLKLAPSFSQKLQFVEGYKWIARHLEREKPAYFPSDPEGTAEEKGEKSTGHVILCGYGPTGSLVMQKLKTTALPVVVIDLNYRVVQSLNASGQTAIYGDSSSLHILEAAGIEHAEMIVVTIPDPVAMREIVKKVRRRREDIHILMRVKYESDMKKLQKLGANEIVWEEFEAGQELANRVLQKLQIHPQEQIEEKPNNSN